VLFKLWDIARGIGDDTLQEIFREVIVGGFGGFLAVSPAASWFSRVNLRIVFFSFTAFMLLTAGIYIGAAIFLFKISDLTPWTLFLSLVVVVSAIVGSYMRVKKEI